MHAILAILWVLLSIVAIVGGFSLIIWLSNRVSEFIHRTPCPKCGCKEKIKTSAHSLTEGDVYTQVSNTVTTSKNDVTKKCKNCGHVF